MRKTSVDPMLLHAEQLLYADTNRPETIQTSEETPTVSNRLENVGHELLAETLLGSRLGVEVLLVLLLP